MPLELFNLNNINNLYSSNRGGADFTRYSGWIMVTIIGADSVYPVMVHIQSYAFAAMAMEGAKPRLAYGRKKKRLCATGGRARRGE